MKVPGEGSFHPPKSRLSPRVITISIIAHIVFFSGLFYFVPDLAPKKMQPVLRYFELGRPQRPKERAGKPVKSVQPSMPAADPVPSVPVIPVEPVSGQEAMTGFEQTGETGPVSEGHAGGNDTAGTGQAPDSSVSKPVPRRKLQLVHPERALLYGVEGKATVWYIVNEKGKVTQAGIVSEAPRGYGFGFEALRAIRQCAFDPARQNGRPVASRATQEIVFILN